MISHIDLSISGECGAEKGQDAVATRNLSCSLKAIGQDGKSFLVTIIITYIVK